jgi:hypothetical protein
MAGSNVDQEFVVLDYRNLLSTFCEEGCEISVVEVFIC